MICRKCGNEVPSRRLFCGSCGKKVPQNTQPLSSNINVNTTKQASLFDQLLNLIKYAATGFVAVVVGIFALSHHFEQHRLDDPKQECSFILSKPMPSWPDCAAEMAPKPFQEGDRSYFPELKSTFGGCGMINDQSERARYEDCKKYGLPRSPDFYDKSSR